MLIFCQIPLYDRYDGTEGPDPASMNFLPITVEDGNGGTYELVFGALHQKTALPASLFSEEVLTGVTVVFCAKTEKGGLSVVGWYRETNATLAPEILPCETEDGQAFDHPYFFCAHAGNAVLLPPEERYRPMWSVPRNKTGKKGKLGFPSDVLWIPDEAEAASFCREMLEKLDAYEGPTLQAELDTDAD